MANNKEIIIRIIVSFVFFGLVARIVIPLLIDKMKGKSLGLSKNPDDLDFMIKRQKESLKSQFQIKDGLNPKENLINQSQTVNEIRKEISWGGNQLQKDLKAKILKDFSYGFSDSKISAFITLVEKRNYLQFADRGEKLEYESILNFLTILFIFLVSIDEIKMKEFAIVEKCAKKLSISPMEFALGIQMKILLSLKEGTTKADRIFVDTIVLHQYSEETLKQAIEKIISEEANLWKKSISLFFEELSLYLNYAYILRPIPRPINKNDFDTAIKVFSNNKDESFEEVKKTYKKMALQFHPDKIVPQKLPVPLEKKAIAKFNIIQEAFEIVSQKHKERE